MQSLIIQSDGAIFLEDRTLKKATNPNELLRTLGLVKMVKPSDRFCRLRICVSPTVILTAVWGEGKVPAFYGAIQVPEFSMRTHVLRDSASRKWFIHPRADGTQVKPYYKVIFRRPGIWFGYGPDNVWYVVVEETHSDRIRYSVPPIPNTYETGRQCTGRLAHSGLSGTETMLRACFENWQANFCNRDVNFWEDTEVGAQNLPLTRMESEDEDEDTFLCGDDWGERRYTNTVFTEMLAGGPSYDILS